MTLAVLAKELGVSKATVSNAYNRPDQLSSALRRKILKTAERMGYAGPNPVAATLSRGRAGAIGLVFDDPVSYVFDDPAQVRLVGGVSDVCADQGIGLLLIPGGVPTDLTAHALVDGFIFHSDLVGDERIGIALDRRLPVVVVDGPVPEGVPRVGIDDRAAAYAAASHVLGMGHRRLGIIPTPLAVPARAGLADADRLAEVGYQTSADRLAGYRGAATESGVDFETALVSEQPGYTRQSGYLAARVLLAAEPRPTAILAMSDELAAGAIDAANDFGVSVPEQLSVVGFDDVPIPRTPRLTTIHQPHRDKGATAARILIGLASANDVTFGTRLVVGATTAPPERCGDH